MVAQPPIRISWIEFVRAYAIVLVVMVHASGPPLYGYNTVSHEYWWTANLFDSFSRTCVPLFIMVSGYLLLGSDKEESLGDFFRKRFAKVFVPYLFWAFFYLLWRKLFHHEIRTSQFARELIAGTPYYHLVFMNVIIGLYLLAPMLRVFVKNANIQTQLYMLGLWIGLSSLTPLFTKLSSYQVNLYLQTTPIFLGHFLFGGLMRKLEFDLKRWHYAALTTILIATGIVTAILTHTYTRRNAGILDEYFYTYASPNVVIMSMISFVLLRAIFSKPIFQLLPVITPLIRQIGALSFGIYFTHVVMLECLGRGIFFNFPLTATTFHPCISIPLITAIVVITCTGAVWLIQKIPGLRFILP